jgi:hypothetical protein
MLAVKLDHVHSGWRCARLANEKVEMVATIDVGPRIIRFAFLGQANELFENPADRGQRGGREWRPYGGHRLWHAPEAMPRTYAPDNDPVDASISRGAVILWQAVEPSTGIEKTMELRLHEERAEAEILHRLTNRGAWPIDLAVWPLTVLAPGGTAVLPLGRYIPFPEQLTPARPLVLWSYTNPNDARFSWDARFVRLRQDRAARAPVKIGLLVDEGWIAYHRTDHLFLKRFERPDRSKRYPDFGANVEVFTNSEMIELETLSPMVTLAPGSAIEHVERWALFDRVPRLADEDDVEREVVSRARG